MSSYRDSSRKKSWAMTFARSSNKAGRGSATESSCGALPMQALKFS